MSYRFAQHVGSSSSSKSLTYGSSTCSPSRSKRPDPPSMGSTRSREGTRRAIESQPYKALMPWIPPRSQNPYGDHLPRTRHGLPQALTGHVSKRQAPTRLRYRTRSTRSSGRSLGRAPNQCARIGAETRSLQLATSVDLRSVRRPPHRAYPILHQRDEDHHACCRVCHASTETERPNYAPGVDQPRSDHHPSQGSQCPQDLFTHPFLLLARPAKQCRANRPSSHLHDPCPSRHRVRHIVSDCREAPLADVASCIPCPVKPQLLVEALSTHVADGCIRVEVAVPLGHQPCR